MSYRELRGVSGWLAFLVVSLLVLTPLFGTARTYGAIASTEQLYPQLVGTAIWSQIKTATWLFFAAQAGLLFSAGWRLAYRFVPGSVRYAIAMLWIAGPTLTLLSLVVIGAISGANVFAQPEGGQALGGVFGGIISAGLWTAYLIRSRRVRNTYYESDSWLEKTEQGAEVTP